MLRLCAAFVLSLLPIASLADTVSGKIRVIDGDTFRVAGEAVRLHGIDAPERDQTCGRADGSSFDCGAWVTRETVRRYGGRRAVCEVVDTDRYGRKIGICRVDGTDVARALVRDGLAFAYRRFSLDYDLDEKGAAVRSVGLHAYEVQSPQAFRRAQAPAPSAPAANPGCTIKGNVSNNGRIYHMPGQEHYDRTRISPARGERWFCSEAEARAAGWRKARR